MLAEQQRIPPIWCRRMSNTAGSRDLALLVSTFARTKRRSATRYESMSPSGVTILLSARRRSTVTVAAAAIGQTLRPRPSTQSRTQSGIRQADRRSRRCSEAGIVRDLGIWLDGFCALRRVDTMAGLAPAHNGDSVLCTAGERQSCGQNRAARMAGKPNQKFPRL